MDLSVGVTSDNPHHTPKALNLFGIIVDGRSDEMANSKL